MASSSSTSRTHGACHLRNHIDCEFGIEAGRANPTLSTLEALAEGVGATLGVVIE